MNDGLDGGDDRQDARARILAAASELIADGGVVALTTRAVAKAAAVQAPTLYRLFGDKRGLLNAVAEHGLATFLARKRAVPPHPDPVEGLREAWDAYIAFGLAHPAVFAITNEIGAPASGSPAMLAGLAILRERVGRIARAGRLHVPVERAVALIHAAGVGTVATLLATDEDVRDPQLSPLARDAVFAAVVGDPPAPDGVGLASLAVGLRAHLAAAAALTPGERLLMNELLGRLSEPTEAE
ncbi:TetR/AcrR family transcriptional regulator [Methylobacterium sp. J-001]|nr:TetR/AcrR family transcriptional regulator [Methylobacterium sp. J-001]MCJ2118765.1 TetR/AcrR family transcriptional regulator [Methylobacterium sp. J-001]TXN55404.1 TetR/AcrR family transcriptional regulator [Methylobacterium sp. WL2]